MSGGPAYVKRGRKVLARRAGEAFGHFPAMTKPATNAELPGHFLVYNL